MTISIHRIVVSEHKYIFKSERIANFFVYVHIIDADTKAILIQNDNTKLIKLFRNFRLKNLIEINFFNAMHINTKYLDLILKRSNFIYDSIQFIKKFKSYSANFDDKLSTFHVDKNQSKNIDQFKNSTLE